MSYELEDGEWDTVVMKDETAAWVVWFKETEGRPTQHDGMSLSTVVYAFVRSSLNTYTYISGNKILAHLARFLTPRPCHVYPSCGPTDTTDSEWDTVIPKAEGAVHPGHINCADEAFKSLCAKFIKGTWSGVVRVPLYSAAMTQHNQTHI